MIYGLASKHFGITNLHPFQLQAVSTAISGHDSLVIQSTGKGKSLCYQLVALQRKQLVFVFVPTLALMYDQVLHLQAKGVAAAALGSEGDSIDTLSNYTGACVVYLTAKHVYGPSGECNRRLGLLQQLADEGRIALIVIDEAHLLLEWEHFRLVSTFCYLHHNTHLYSESHRPSFTSLKSISDQFQSVPVMALTATAPPELQSELEGILHDPEVMKGSVDRPNIAFTARKSKYGGQMPKSVADGKQSAGMYLKNVPQ